MVTYPKTTTIEGIVTIDGTSYPLDSLPNAIVVRAHLDEYIRFMDRPLMTQVTISSGVGSESLEQAIPDKRAKKVPEEGKTTRDYIIRVLTMNPGGLYTTDLVQKMFEEGWQTASKNPAHFVKITMYQHKDQFARYGKRWGLVRHQDVLKV